MVNSIQVNANKSGILVPRVDWRTPSPSLKCIDQIPLVKEYKYLGVLFDDAFNFTADLSLRNKIVSKLETSSWLLRARFLNRDTAHHVWQALFKSRSYYMMKVLLYFSKKMTSWYLKTMYRSLMSLFRLKGKPSKTKVFSLVFGTTTEEFLKFEAEEGIASWLLKQQPGARENHAKVLNINFATTNDELTQIIQR